MNGNENEGGHTEWDWSPYERSIVQGGVQRGRIRSGNEDEGKTRMRENILGRDQIGVSGSCVRTGSDMSTTSLLVTLIYSSVISYFLCSHVFYIQQCQSQALLLVGPIAL